MAIDEHARHRLYLRLEEHLGAEAASTLMEHLPPTGWSEVAAKRDLDHLRAATKTDLDHLRAATKADLDHLRAATKTDLDHLQELTDARFTQFVDQLRAEFHRGLATHTIAIVFATIASNAAAVLAVAQLR